MAPPHPAKVYVYAYILIASLKSAPVVLGARRSGIANRISQACDSVAPMALFAALLPPMHYSLLSSSDSSILRPELLSSTAILLLPRALRLQLTLYAISAAIHSSARQSRIYRHLPPVWWLNAVFNAFLIHAFLADQTLFPKAYRKILLVHPNYIPPAWSEDQLSDFLSNQSEWPLIDESNAPRNGHDSRHKRVLCATMHPDEPSCFQNYMKGWLYELQVSAKWVSIFTTLATLYARRRQVTQSPGKVFAEWAVSTARMTLFVAGSINTSWAMLCALQRILPPSALPRARFLINGLIGSLWILVLPPRRREQISLWVARMGALVAWEMWVKGGGFSIKYAEVVMFALAWIRLSDLRQKGAHVDGLVGAAMKYLEQA